jgi:hypothetical protein
MDKRPGTVVGHLVEFVALTERRRLVVAVGIPLLFVALFELTANFGVLVLLLAAGLAMFLYTRTTAQKTIAASAYGAGVLLVSLFALELYWNGAQGSTEPLIGTATRLLWWAVTGVLLVGVGLWLRQIDL